MPNIREYTAPEDSLKVGDQGASDAAQAGDYASSTADKLGRTFGSVVSEAGGILQQHQKAAEDAAALTEISGGMKSLMATQLDLDKQEQTALASGDPDARSKYMEASTQAWTDWAGTFKTERGKTWAMDRAITGQESSMRSITADMANKAGADAVDNIHSSVDAAGMLVGNHGGDTQFLDAQLEHLNSGIDNSIATVPGFRGQMAAEGKGPRDLHFEAGRATVNASLDAFIRERPYDAQAALESGQYDKYAANGWTAQDKNDALNKAATAVKLTDEAKTHQMTEIEKQQKADVNATSAGLYAGTISADGTQKLGPNFWSDVKAFSTKPGVTGPDISALAAYGQKIEKGDGATKNDQTVFANLSSRIGLDPTDPHAISPTEVYRDVADGSLMPGDKGAGIFLGAAEAANKGARGVPAENTADGDAFKTLLESHTPRWDENGAPDPTTYAADMSWRQWYLMNFTNGINVGKTRAQMIYPVTPDGKENPDYLGRAPEKGGYDANKPITSQPIMYPPGVKAPVAAGPQAAKGMTDEEVAKRMGQ